jgi:hypothetical protein
MKLYIPLNTKVYYFDESMLIRNNLHMICSSRVRLLVGYTKRGLHNNTAFYRIYLTPDTFFVYDYVIPYAYVLEAHK